MPKLKDEPEEQEDEGQNHKKGSEKKKNEENKDGGAKSSVGKLPDNRGPRRETYKQKIIDTIIQRFAFYYISNILYIKYNLYFVIALCKCYYVMF